MTTAGEVPRADAEEIAVLAVDTLAQRAVIRLRGERAVVVSKAGAIPGSSMRVTAVLADRIEVESTASDGRGRRMWWFVDPDGKANGVTLDARPASAGVAAPMHGTANRSAGHGGAVSKQVK